MQLEFENMVWKTHRRRGRREEPRPPSPNGVRGHAVGFFLCVLRVSASRRFQKKLPVDFTCIVPAKSSRKPPATAQIPVAREEQTERPQKRSAIPEAVQPGRGRGGYLVGFQPGEHLAEFFRRHDASAASLRERALGFADR